MERRDIETKASSTEETAESTLAQLKIEIEPELLAQLKSYCKRQGIFIRSFVADLIKRELASTAVPVKKKSIQTLSTSYSDDVWSRKPFWDES